MTIPCVIFYFDVLIRCSTEHLHKKDISHNVFWACFGLGGIFCIGVLGDGIMALAHCHKIYKKELSQSSL